MRELLTCTLIERIKDRVHAIVVDYRQRRNGCHYIDVRLDVSAARGGYAKTAPPMGAIRMPSCPRASASRLGRV